MFFFIRNSLKKYEVLLGQNEVGLRRHALPGKLVAGKGGQCGLGIKKRRTLGGAPALG